MAGVTTDDTLYNINDEGTVTPEKTVSASIVATPEVTTLPGVTPMKATVHTPLEGVVTPERAQVKGTNTRILGAVTFIISLTGKVIDRNKSPPEAENTLPDIVYK